MRTRGQVLVEYALILVLVVVVVMVILMILGNMGGYTTKPSPMIGGGDNYNTLGGHNAIATKIYTIEQSINELKTLVAPTKGAAQ